MILYVMRSKANPEKYVFGQYLIEHDEEDAYMTLLTVNESVSYHRHVSRISHNFSREYLQLFIDDDWKDIECTSEARMAFQNGEIEIVELTEEHK